MINYDSDGDKILSEKDIQEVNIVRIQTKLRCVSIGEFAKFVDFTNNEFKTAYCQFNQLNSAHFKSEERYRQELLSVTKAHNSLIEALINRQFNPQVSNQQYIDDLRDSLLDDK